MNKRKKRSHALPEEEKFSVTLDNWLKDDNVKTVAGLSDVFAEKAFAITFLILMAVPAIPAPTAGITHVFEVIVMLLSLELIIQRKTIWLPKRFESRPLGKIMETKVIPKLITVVRKIERFSKPRMSRLLESRIGTTLFGAVTFAFALAAFLSPPVGLDTLPSFGVVIIALGVILEDIVFAIVGAVIGVAGIAVTIFLGQVIVDFFTRLF